MSGLTKYYVMGICHNGYQFASCEFTSIEELWVSYTVMLQRMRCIPRIFFFSFFILLWELNFRMNALTLFFRPFLEKNEIHAEKSAAYKMKFSCSIAHLSLHAIFDTLYCRFRSLISGPRMKYVSRVAVFIMLPHELFPNSDA